MVLRYPLVGGDEAEHRDLTLVAAALAAAGIKVLRFSNQEALAATEFVALRILDEVECLTAASPTPSVGNSLRRDALLPHPGPLPR
jgi:hypothetical protein